MNLEKYGIVQENVSLKKLNTYHIDTTARFLLHPRNVFELQAFLKDAKEKNWAYFVLGNGSNVILDDKPYPGIILKLDQFSNVLYHGNEVEVESGVMIQSLATDIIHHGLKGLEWASGIPGTIGGSIFGNAGAYKDFIFHYLKEVTFFNEDGELISKKREDLSYDYRTSFFKEHPKNIIVKATFYFPDGEADASFLLIKDRLLRRLASQPLEYPSAGSVFRNPTEDCPSGKIIDELGLKGTRIGGAKVSEKHANFIINIANATGKDIRDLIKLVHDKVKEDTGMDLILEQEIKDW